MESLRYSASHVPHGHHSAQWSRGEQRVTDVAWHPPFSDRRRRPEEEGAMPSTRGRPTALPGPTLLSAADGVLDLGATTVPVERAGHARVFGHLAPSVVQPEPPRRRSQVTPHLEDVRAIAMDGGGLERLRHSQAQEYWGGAHAHHADLHSELLRVSLVLRFGVRTDGFPLEEEQEHRRSSTSAALQEPRTCTRRFTSRRSLD